MAVVQRKSSMSGELVSICPMLCHCYRDIPQLLGLFKSISSLKVTTVRNNEYALILVKLHYNGTYLAVTLVVPKLLVEDHPPTRGVKAILLLHITVQCYCQTPDLPFYFK